MDLIDAQLSQVVLRLSGVLDLATVRAVEDLITALWGGGDLVLDLTGLRFCDCTGLGMFIRLSRQCAIVGRSLRLVATGGPVLMVMTALKFGDTVPVYADLPAARYAGDAHRTTHIRTVRASCDAGR